MDFKTNDAIAELRRLDPESPVLRHFLEPDPADENFERSCKRLARAIDRARLEHARRVEALLRVES